MPAYAAIDESRPPVVHVRVVNSPDDENYPEYLDGIAEAFRRYERFAFIFDTGELTRFPSKYRDMQSRWLAETKPEFDGRWLCAAFVIPNRTIRGVLMALYWLNPPYYPYVVVATQAQAWDFVTSVLDEVGIPVAGP